MGVGFFYWICLYLQPMEKKEQFDFQTGEILLFDKPLDWTSFDVVKKVRKGMRYYSGKKTKVGHAGTLDPKASGLLILCTGRFTKKIESLQGQSKEYTGSFKLGATTPSFDTETTEEAICDIGHITEEMIKANVDQFIGPIEQAAPLYSALKIEGKRMYNLVREGVELKPKIRTVLIKEFEITKIEGPFVHFRVLCGKGTYIRSLANDFGQSLGCGAYLSTLRRTKIGEFDVTTAWDINEFVDLVFSKKME